MQRSLIFFITGATSGFGAAIARHAVAAGHRAVIAGRRFDRLQQLGAELGDAVHAIELDVRDNAAVIAAFDNLPPAFAAVDVLVNNAGLALGLEPAHAALIDDWDRMVDTNIKGLMYCTRAALPSMVGRGRGHIINIGSIAGEFPYPGGNVYGGTKAFVYQFSLNLRADLLGKNIRVTDIEPGLSGGTEFSNVRFHGDDEKAANVYAGTQPLDADDVADAVMWAATRPSHVNINSIQLMPVCQAFGALAVERN